MSTGGMAEVGAPPMSSSHAGPEGGPPYGEAACCRGGGVNSDGASPPTFARVAPGVRRGSGPPDGEPSGGAFGAESRADAPEGPDGPASHAAAAPPGREAAGSGEASCGGAEGREGLFGRSKNDQLSSGDDSTCGMGGTAGSGGREAPDGPSDRGRSA